jgi:hypothetical protein
MQEDRQEGRKKKCSGDRTYHSAYTFEAETKGSEMDMFKIRIVSQLL